MHRDFEPNNDVQLLGCMAIHCACAQDGPRRWSNCKRQRP